VDVPRSLTSAWSDGPLLNEDGGGLLCILVVGFGGVVFTAFGGDLAAAGDGTGLGTGGEAIG
jgi:hypothetical protein